MKSWELFFELHRAAVDEARRAKEAKLKQEISHLKKQLKMTEETMAR